MSNTKALMFALLATLIALVWSSWEWVAYQWGGLTEGQRAAIVTLCGVVLCWALWPVAKWLSMFFF